MQTKYPPISEKCPHFLHGGDYNPDQWVPAEALAAMTRDSELPEVWAEDMRLAKLAGCNAMSVGIFSWAQLEPAEGRFTFGWLDRVMDMLADNGAYAVLATPSAAHPAWLSASYPEVLRVHTPDVPPRHRVRVNFCPTSEVFREKCRLIDRKLAERYKDHPALLLWHIGNEFAGVCYCEKCKAAFHQWLRRKYASIDALNRAWWTGFWSHTYADFAQVELPGEHGENSIHGLTLDWQRFASDQLVACLASEAAVLREVSPDIPLTSNTWGYCTSMVPRQLADLLDVMSVDPYPKYHDRDDMWRDAVGWSMLHDFYRSLKGGRPYIMMEGTPGSACGMGWMPVMKLKRPGIHRLASLQAVGHGSDTVQYFQWRAGRGGCEKFHGAVVMHDGTEHTRLFGTVAEVGGVLKKLDGVVGTTVRPEAAVIYDKENHWAIDAAHGPRRRGRDYDGTCKRHYGEFWGRGIPVDVIDEEADFRPYRLLVAPMLYMLRPGVAERIEKFVEGGGTFVTTYWSGIADENDLCFRGGFPGPLRKLLGVWAEELDVLHDDERNTVVAAEGAAGLAGEYEAHVFCDRIHAEGAEVLATYGEQFYAGEPAVTVNAFGEGKAYYVASRNDERFLADFYGAIAGELGLARVIDAELPRGVTAQMRTDGQRTFVFLLNFTREPKTVAIGGEYADVIGGGALSGSVELPGYGSMVLERR
jgi:beta-galactosidase